MSRPRLEDTTRTSASTPRSEARASMSALFSSFEVVATRW